MRKGKLKLYLQNHPFGLQGMIGKAFALLIQIVILALSVHPVWQISAELVQTILSAGMQILAALYGLIFTGYIFFIGNQEQNASADSMRADVVLHMKKRFYRNILLATAFFALSLLMGMLVMFLEGADGVPPFVKRLLFGEAFALFLSTGSVILAFVITILDPDLIEKISTHGQQQLSEENTSQDYSAAFTENYRSIETIMQTQFEDLHGYSAAKLSVERIANDLHVNRLLEHNLWRKLAKLSQFNSFHHFSNRRPVSEDMYLLSDEVLRRLRDGQ